MTKAHTVEAQFRYHSHLTKLQENFTWEKYDHSWDFGGTTKQHTDM